MAQLCRSTGGWIRLPAKEGQRSVAAAAWVRTRCATASRLSRRPVRVQRVAGSPSPFGEPGADKVDHRAGEGHGAVFAAFAFRAHPCCSGLRQRLIK